MLDKNEVVAFCSRCKGNIEVIHCRMVEHWIGNKKCSSSNREIKLSELVYMEGVHHSITMNEALVLLDDRKKMVMNGGGVDAIS